HVPPLFMNFIDFYDLFSVGSGLLNVQAAISNSDLAPGNVGTALSPTAVYNNGTVSLVYGNSTVSTNSVVWGSSVVWGGSVVWGASTGRGTSGVWGAAPPAKNNTLSAFSVVWGASTGTSSSAMSVVWGAPASSATSAFSDA